MEYFTAFPSLAPYAEALSITLVVLVITYLTLIFGELVPKLEIANGRPCSAPLPPVRSARTVSLVFSSIPVGTEDTRDFVAGSSSPAAPSRSSRTVTRTARRWFHETL